MEMKHLLLCLVTMCLVTGQDAADMNDPQTNLLHQAVRYLVNYTASEAGQHMDMYDIGSTVAAIAYDKLIEQLGKYACNCSSLLTRAVVSVQYLIGQCYSLYLPHRSDIPEAL